MLMLNIERIAKLKADYYYTIPRPKMRQLMSKILDKCLLVKVRNDWSYGYFRCDWIFMPLSR